MYEFTYLKDAHSVFSLHGRAFTEEYSNLKSNKANIDIKKKMES